MNDFYTKNFNEIHENLNMKVAISKFNEGFTMFNLNELGYKAPYESSFIRPNYFVFLFVKKGFGKWITPENKYDLVPYIINFANVNILRQFQYDNLDEVHIIIFEEYFLKKYINKNIYSKLPFLLSENIIPHKANKEFYISMENIYLQMYNEFNLPNRDYNILGHFLAIILHKFNNEYFMNYDPIIEGKENSKIVNNFKLHLEENFKNLVEGSTTKMFKLSDYARLQNYHQSYFNSIIVSKTGKSVKNWISDKIIYESKILLKLSNLSIKEISNMFNYSEPTHFTHFFKTKTGITPKKYKQM